MALMTEGGAEIDIVTGKPKEMIQEQKRRESAQKEEESLKRRMEFLGITGSDAGQRIVAMIQQLLDRRADELLQMDVEAQAYIKILSEMGIRESQARRATDRWIKMKTGKEE